MRYAVSRVIVDVTREDAVAHAFDEAVLAYGGIDILVSNAGIASASPIEDTSLALWQKNIDVLATGYFLKNKMEGWAFIMTSLNIVLTQVTFFTMIFPNVMISSTNPAYSLTITNASSSQYTLTVMSVIALIFVPIVLAYQGWTYYMFRKRISNDKKSLVY